MLDFDVETTGLQPYADSSKVYPFLFQFKVPGQDPVAFKWGPNQREHDAEIQAWFDKGAVDGIRAWNSKFDFAFAERAGFKLPPEGKWHDGMLVAHAIDERRSVALKSIAVSVLGEGSDDLQKEVKTWLNKENARRRKAAKADGTEYEPANYSDVPDEIMIPYGVEDVVLTEKVCEVFDATLENAPALKRVVEFERETLATLYAIEKRGLPARAEEYRKLENEVIENLEALEDKVQKLAQKGDPVIYAKELAKGKWAQDEEWVEVSEGGVVSYRGGARQLSDFNPSSSAQVLAALKARGADMRFMSEKDGKLSADADNLRAVDDELAAAILEFRSEAKVHSTYVRPMIDRSYVSAMNTYKEPFIGPDSRIHATYRQVGARTGRMSCSDPNIQNQPRDDLRLRYNIVADPGYKLVTCDLSNIEMVLFAAYCGSGRLLDAVRAGEDLHVLTAKMLGLKDRKRAGGSVESARQLGKTYNFSRIYGGGLRTIRRSFRCTIDEARLLKSRFDRAYPEVQRLSSRIEYKLYDQGYVEDALISGRRFRVEPRDAYKATNYLVQGTAASLLKYAINQLHKDGVPMVALVHDEVIAHCPENDAQEVHDLIIKRLTYHPGLEGVVPLRADGDIVDRWSQAKDPAFVPGWAA
jgi:DNA polymerase I-like protein with 3'-5' exonuclease and polymerase domains